MTIRKYEFAVIGGDLRQIYAAGFLKEKGYRVCTYATEKKLEEIPAAASLKAAVENSEVIVAPIPLTKDGIGVQGKLNTQDMGLGHLAEVIQKGQLLCAGCIPMEWSRIFEERKVQLLDLMQLDSLALFNTIATAEGAVAEAICRSPKNLHKSRCLVLGYGKCGKTLAGLLKGMSAQVDVYARREDVRAEASILADRAVEEEEMCLRMNSYDFIFNTIPFVILDRSTLSLLSREALVVDVASAPGGVDYDAARELGKQAVLCPGLPGKYAPESSGKAIGDAVENFMKVCKENEI